MQKPDGGRGASRGGRGDQRQQRGARTDQLEKRKVFVGNIGAEATEDDVRRSFENLTVEKVYLRCGGEKKAHCFVVFSTEAEAQEALQGSFMLNNHPIAVKVACSRPEAGGVSNSSATSRDHGEGSRDGSGETKDKQKEAFLANLPNQVEEEDILRLFEKYGAEKVVLKKPDNKRPFAFLTLRDQQAVAAAVSEMNDHTFLGRRISVQYAGQKSGPASQSNRTASNRNERSSEGGNSDESWDIPSSGPSVGTSASQPNWNMLNRTNSSSKGGDSDESWDNPPSGPSLGTSVSQPNRNMLNRTNSSSKGGDSDESWDNPPSGPSGDSSASQPERNVQNRKDFSSEGADSGDSWDSASHAPSHVLDTPSPSANLDGPPPLRRVANARMAGDAPPPLIPAKGRGLPAAFNGPLMPQWTANGPGAHDGPPPLERVSHRQEAHEVQHDGPKVSSRNEVFVGNLKADVTEDEIRGIFEKYGVVRISLKAKGPKPVCFVALESAASIEHAVQDLNGASVGNQHNLAVRRADDPKPNSKPESSKQKADAPASKDFSNINKLFVANLPKEVTKDDVRHLFDKYGVKEIFLITTKGLPYAFVKLTSGEGFNRALEEMQGFMFQDHKLFIGLPATKDGGAASQPHSLPRTPPFGGGSDGPSQPSESSPVVLCIANFPPETKMADVVELFSSWDPLEVVMGKSESSGLGPYPHAYVTLANRDMAEAAVLDLNKTYFRGRVIIVLPVPEKCPWSSSY
ncbi:uncharacterized protein LOC144124987 isoform X1 [Amblyomma americanum]